MFRISVYGSEQLQAVLLAIRQSDRTVQANIRKFTKQLIVPEWQEEIRSHASSRLESKVLVNTARAAVSNQNLRLSTATVGRSLTGGFDPKAQAHAAEYGADSTTRKTYLTRSRKGKSYTVTRHTTRQLRPRRRGGYVFGPAVSAIAPRVLALWVQTTVRTMHDAFEGKSSG